jgi:hypothetical protein
LSTLELKKEILGSWTFENDLNFEY